MAWQYSQAIRVGDRVTILLRDPPSGRERPVTVDRYGTESEADFKARGREVARSWVAGLEAERQQELDVTNDFRPGPTPPGDKA
jgi:hypothetical protein